MRTYTGRPAALLNSVIVKGHPAESLIDRRPVAFTAHSAESAYLRERICAFAFQCGVIPLNPWMVGGYFLYGLAEKDDVRRANNNLILRSDELWVFGSITDGVEVEIELARRNGMPVKFFDLDHYGEAITASREGVSDV